MSEGLCTSCGAAVNLAAGQDEIKCSYCGTLVKRPEAESKLNEVMSSKAGGAFMLADTAMASRQYKKALEYYNKAIEADPTSSEAWFRKAFCFVRAGGEFTSYNKLTSTEETQEAIISLKTAIKFSKDPEAAKKRAAICINDSVVEVIDKAAIDDMFFKVETESRSPAQCEGTFLVIVSFLAEAIDFDSGAINKIARTGISLCDAGIKCCSAHDKTDAMLAVANFKRPTNYDASGLKRIRAKFEQLLSEADPNYAKQVAAKTKDASIKAEKEKNDAKQGGIGCLMITCFILLIPFGYGAIVRTLKAQGLMDTTQELSEHVAPAIFFSIVSVVLVIVIAVSFRKYNSMFKSVEKKEIK